MISGSVSETFDPRVQLKLIGVDHSTTLNVWFVVDTGFNGDLSLPEAIVAELGWPFQSTESVELANGQKCTMPLFRGIIWWKGEERFAHVFGCNSQPLLGRSLLYGNEVWIRFRPGGDVMISSIDDEATEMSATSSKPLIGLVGGIGSGKSLVASAFASRGGHVITADAFGHEALQQPEILARITERWKDRVLNEQGNVDRKKIGAIVFGSPVERANLEMLVFPWIEERIRAEIAKVQADPNIPFVVLDAAIMLEAGWNKVCSKIVYVHAPRALRLERLSTLRGWTANDLAQREAVQLPLAVKAARADVAVDNSGSAENTRKQVDALLRLWHIL